MIRCLVMINYEKKWLILVRSLLLHNVPRFIKHIADRGGVHKEEWQWLQCEEDSPDYPEGVLARADEYLLYPKDEKTLKHGVFVFVKMLAIMAFIPGGVRVFGLHFCSEIDGFVATDNDPIWEKFGVSIDVVIA